MVKKDAQHKDISIHTPTQGVTLYNVMVFGQAEISIHTPTQGVTPSYIAILTAI